MTTILIIEDEPELSKILRSYMEQAGFTDVSYRNLSFGIACIHVGRKPAGAVKAAR